MWFGQHFRRYCGLLRATSNRKRFGEPKYHCVQNQDWADVAGLGLVIARGIFVFQMLFSSVYWFRRKLSFRRLPWMPKASIHFSRLKSSGATCDIIQSGLVSFP